MAQLPSKTTLCALLGLDDQQGRSVRQLLEAHHCNEYLQATLANISDVISGLGVEYIPSKQDTVTRLQGLAYVNTGHPYQPTIIYDHGTQRFLCGAWGRIVECNPRRF